MDCGSFLLWAVVIWIAWGIGVWLMDERKPREQKPVPEQKSRHTEREVEPPAPTTNEQVASATAEYERALRMIDGLPVEETEKEMAKRQAKRKFMKRIRELVGDPVDQ